MTGIALRLACLVAGFLAAATPLQAAGPQVIEEGGQIVGLTGLNDSEDCAFATVSGEVLKVDKAAKGKLPEGFDLRSEYGDSYVNLEELPAGMAAAKRKEIMAALTGMLKKGAKLEFGLHGCGASGRIEKLVSVRLPASGTSDAGTGSSGNASGGNGSAVADAVIAGTFSYPSDYIPEDLKACAEEVDSGAEICTSRHIVKGSWTHFELKVPAGRYLVYAQRTDAEQVRGSEQGLDYRAYYSEFVTCGLDASCRSHKPIVVEATSGRKVTAAPHDWYVRQ